MSAIPYNAVPATGVMLMRPDTKREKAMGWALALPTSLLVHLELKTKRPNESFRGMTAGAAMGVRAHNAKCREWTKAALLQALVPDAEKPRPARVTLTRISSGTMDDDGLVSCFKHVRDGVALALGFNDREFSIAGQRPGGIPIFYEQVPPGKRGVFGVRIEVRWS